MSLFSHAVFGANFRASALRFFLKDSASFPLQNHMSVAEKYCLSVLSDNEKYSVARPCTFQVEKWG